MERLIQLNCADSYSNSPHYSGKMQHVDWFLHIELNYCERIHLLPLFFKAKHHSVVMCSAEVKYEISQACVKLKSIHQIMCTKMQESIFIISDKSKRELHTCHWVKSVLGIQWFSSVSKEKRGVWHPALIPISLVNLFGYETGCQLFEATFAISRWQIKETGSQWCKMLTYWLRGHNKRGIRRKHSKA